MSIWDKWHTSFLCAGLLCLTPISLQAKLVTNPNIIDKLDYTHQLLISKLAAAPRQLTKQEFNQLLQALVLPAVALTDIARKVMGKHAAVATVRQQQALAQQLLTRLFIWYRQYRQARNLNQINLEYVQSKQITRNYYLVSYAMYLPPHNPYKLSYSMSLHGEQLWLVNNIWLNDLNLVLAWSHRFTQLMHTYARNIDKVVASWNTPSQL
jgi:ABC-type transporter MlaC component